MFILHYMHCFMCCNNLCYMLLPYMFTMHFIPIFDFRFRLILDNFVRLLHILSLLMCSLYYIPNYNYYFNYHLLYNYCLILMYYINVFHLYLLLNNTLFILQHILRYLFHIHLININLHMLLNSY